MEIIWFFQLKNVTLHFRPVFIITLNFFLPCYACDPVINLLGEDFIAGKEAVEKIREELGLNRPILVQYANYWKNLFQFDLGYSYHFELEFLL